MNTQGSVLVKQRSYSASTSSGLTSSSLSGSLLPGVIRVTSQPSIEVRGPRVDSRVTLLCTFVSKGHDSDLIPNIFHLIQEGSSRISLTGILSSFRWSCTNEVVVDALGVRNGTAFDTGICFVTLFVGDDGNCYFHQVLGDVSSEGSSSPSDDSCILSSQVNLVKVISRETDGSDGRVVCEVDLSGQLEDSNVIVSSPGSIVFMGSRFDDIKELS